MHSDVLYVKYRIFAETIFDGKNVRNKLWYQKCVFLLEKSKLLQFPKRNAKHTQNVAFGFKRQNQLPNECQFLHANKKYSNAFCYLSK